MTPVLVTGDLVTGAGLDAALVGVGTVLHLVFISIVGVDEIPLGYYRQRVEVEGLVSAPGVPSTIQRATQFHSFVERFFTAAALLSGAARADLLRAADRSGGGGRTSGAAGRC